MTTSTGTTTTTQVYRVYIKATAHAVWEAITSPEWTQRYGYRVRQEYELRPGGVYRSLANQAMLDMGSPEVVVEGEVIEADPPRRLVQTWRMLFDDNQRAEPMTRLTWEITEARPGLCALTVSHELDGAPVHAALVAGQAGLEAGGGWPYVLSDLKSLLETGSTLSA